MSTLSSLGTPEQLRDPNYTPPLAMAVPLGIQHVLAMFVSNVTPAIIIAGAAGFGFGSNSPDFPNLIYMIQMSMFFAGIATLFQTIGFGPVGARLPIVQGTSFAFIPIMIPLVAGKGVDAMGALMCGIIVGGIFHACLGMIIGKIRFALPPLVTGLVVTMIGLALVKVGIQYAAGGVPAMAELSAALAAAKASGGAADLTGIEYGSLLNWGIALVVIIVTLAVKFFTRGILSVAAVLIGLLVGYALAWMLGMVNFGNVGRAASFALPNPFHFGFEFSVAAVIGFCLMSFISAIETVGDVSGITKGGAGREATSEEIRGATFADGIGTAISGFFGALPNTSFSQNVGLIAMTGVMSRMVVTIGAVFLIIAGLIPKVGAVISTVPIEVLGGGVIVMFGMVVAAGISMLSDVEWNRRNMVIFAISISVGLGLQLEPNALFFVPGTAKVLLTSGLLPAAFLAIILNLVLPEELADEATEEVSGGMSGHGDGSKSEGA
jgi:xanthine permease